ncbi:MAG: DinB family protein [Spirochaetia bacterium]|jgi:uncharacterized damage-inducible protein DinB
MHTTIAEFVEDWGRESATSLGVQRNLTDASLKQKSDPEGNALGKIAWHMVMMIGITGSAIGLEIGTPPRGTEAPGSANLIADAYQRAAAALGEQARSKLTDAQLAREIDLFGRSVTIAAALQTLIRHQIHHRGQVAVLMRMAGLVVPRIYGPSREETAAMMRAKHSG